MAIGTLARRIGPNCGDVIVRHKEYAHLMINDFNDFIIAISDHMDSNGVTIHFPMHEISGFSL